MHISVRIAAKDVENFNRGLKNNMMCSIQLCGSPFGLIDAVGLHASKC